MVFGIAFSLMMLASASWDMRYRRIPNAFSLATLVLGAVFAATMSDPQAATVHVLGGTATGFVVWLPFWALGMMGAGDVKFFAAASAWIGPQLAIVAALIAALLGGALALCWLIWRACAGSSRSAAFGRAAVISSNRRETYDDSVREQDAPRHSATLPYGVAMAAGLAISAWFPHLFH